MPDDTEPVLVAETGDVRPFARLLRGVGLKHNATMTISPAGFEVTVEEIKTMSAIAWIPHTLFSTFTFNPPPSDSPACFEISLDGLLQCLNIFGNATTGSAGPMMSSKRRWAGEGGEGAEDDLPVAARGKGKTGMLMTWQGHGYPLTIDLQDDPRGPTTSCALRVMEPEELMNVEFDQENCVLYLIMKADLFRDALADLPPTSSRITLSAFPRSANHPSTNPQATAGSSNARQNHRAAVGNFSIKAVGDFGETEFDYPNDKQVMDRFDCEREVSFSYHSSHFGLLGRALSQALSICLQMEAEGLLCIQILMPLAEGAATGENSGILEFKMHALEDDD